jgi:hypothetical protein
MSEATELIDEVRRSAWDHYWKVELQALETDLVRLGDALDGEATALARSPRMWGVTSEYWLMKAHLRFVELATHQGLTALAQAEAAARRSQDPRCLLAVHAHAVERAIVDSRPGDARIGLQRALDDQMDPELTETGARADHTTAMMVLRGRLTVLEATLVARVRQHNPALQLLARADLLAQQLGTDHRVMGCVFGPLHLRADTVYILFLLDRPGPALALAQSIDPTALPPLRRAQFFADCGLIASDLNDFESEESYFNQANALVPEMLERQPAVPAAAAS